MLLLKLLIIIGLIVGCIDGYKQMKYSNIRYKSKTLLDYLFK